MANLSSAKVTIVAHKVGPEVQHYIDANAGFDYDILSSEGDGYNVEKDGDTWTFTGCATGRWSYAANVRGYFGAEGAWLNSDNGPKYRELMDALERTHGSVTLDWLDCDPATDWIHTATASLIVDEDGNASFGGVDVIERWDYSRLVHVADLATRDIESEAQEHFDYANTIGRFHGGI